MSLKSSNSVNIIHPTATTTNRHSVASQSDTEMRRLGGSLDWEDPSLVAALYALFLGTLAPKGARQPKPGTGFSTGCPE